MSKEIVPIERIAESIRWIRGHKVLLDSDLALLYGVATKVLNQAVKRNRERFPDDFMFQLSADETGFLRSQFVTLEKERRTNWSQIVTSSQKHRGMQLRPWAFTEHGALMAANILRSERAVQMSVFVVRAFVRLREQVAANTAILKRLAEIDKTLVQHDAALSDLYRKLLPLLQPSADPTKRRTRLH